MNKRNNEIGQYLLESYWSTVSKIDLPEYRSSHIRVYIPRILTEFMIGYLHELDPKVRHFKIEGERIFDKKIEILDGYELAIVAVIQNQIGAWNPSNFVFRSELNISKADLSDILSFIPDGT